ncbi:MAG TPA: molybdate ABC transporter substrate-binding protein [Acidimicrobiia bacterium]
MRRDSTGLILGMLLVVGACGGDATESVLVSAAASLTDAFTEMGNEFESTHAGIDLVINYGGSSTLREQILEGAPVDVFAPANPSNMDDVVEAGLALTDPKVLARNLLQIAVPLGNPAGVSRLEDLADADLLIGLCAPEVPCGDFARDVLANAGVTPMIDTNEPDVRALLTKIEIGELDAGITYVTDVASADGTVEGVHIPEDVNVVAEYPIVVLAGAPNREGAEAFVEFVLSDRGQEILSQFGFAAP